MIRIVYLLSIKDLSERQSLIDATLRGKRWRVRTARGKWRYVTDRELVDLAQSLQGWTRSVYKFGCAFIHLSDFHDHLAENPFGKLPETERQDVLSHMRHYHGGPCSDYPDTAELSSYLPQIFEKITSNLECYLKALEQGRALDEDR